VLVTGASYLYLRRVAGWDRASAYFGSVPGALTMTLAVAETSPADMRQVSLCQTIRLFMLVAVLPLMVAAVEPGADRVIGAPVIDDPAPLVLLLAVGSLGAMAGVLLKIPSGLLLGAFVAAGLLHGSGIVAGQMPPYVQVPAFVVLGAMLGLRFAGTGWRVLFSMLAAGLGAFAVATATATIGAIAVARALGIPEGQVLVAFAPGGLEAMVILAFVLAVDPAFVAAHHLARFLAMIFVIPVVGPLVYGRQPMSTLPDAGHDPGK
jgi:membrane AbrB-like protein